jgi:hypothetical protein
VASSLLWLFVFFLLPLCRIFLVSLSSPGFIGRPQNQNGRCRSYTYITGMGETVAEAHNVSLPSFWFTVQWDTGEFSVGHFRKQCVHSWGPSCSPNFPRKMWVKGFISSTPTKLIIHNFHPIQYHVIYSHEVTLFNKLRTINMKNIEVFLDVRRCDNSKLWTPYSGSLGRW